MRVVRSKIMGYCSGVVRVIRLANEALALAEERDLAAYSIGWFIHNPTVVEQFERRGMRHIEHPADAQPGVALIRAHGIGDPLRDAFITSGYTLVDGTCHTVAYSQEIIRSTNSSANIIIVGKRGHSEVLALANVWDKNREVIRTHLVETLTDVANLSDFNGEPVVVVVQTTFSQTHYKVLLEALKVRYNGRLRVGNDLCPTTYRRHNALRQLCEEVKAVVVVGGKMSANTASLAHLVEKIGLPVWHIESFRDLPPEIYSFSSVGVSAGASTPYEDIEEVVWHLERGGV